MKNKIKLLYASIFYRVRYTFESVVILKMTHYLKHVFTRPSTEFDLVIIDDFMPNVISAFRTAEFSFLLKKIHNSALYSIIQTKLNKRRKSIDYYIHSKEKFDIYKVEFVKNFQIDAQKVLPFFSWTKIKAKLCYVVFLENAYSLIDYLEDRKIKFILELYPGGGFVLLTEGEQYEKLKRVMASPCFVHVIVTQKVTHRFLIDNNICTPEKISFKYWGISPNLFLGLPEKYIKYGVDKSTIDICFTAGKYMEKGLDKGYDIFIEMAHILLSYTTIFHFHIVGGFTENDIAIDPQYRNFFHFYGFLKTNDFIQYYADKDIFVSPNRPDTLAKGAFDGFPTGTCNDAGQNGLCMIFSDPLDSNFYFENYKDAIFTENDADQIANIILGLSKSPELIYQIGEEGKKTLMKIDPADQLNFRLSLINKFIQID